MAAPESRRRVAVAGGLGPVQAAAELLQGFPVAELAPALVTWQRHAGRSHLPWQHTRDPYRVWLSEIMLQQTQVTTVLGYYERFLDRFPTVAALAAAHLDEVLTLWAGLGYYSRARNLHQCAQAVVARHGGQFPATAAELAELPGIGRSTAAAIASFCFGARSAILDGNVKRVLGRVLAYGEDLARSPAERTLWLAAEALLPTASADMPAYTQGIMDLGATLCLTRQPACPDCPLASLCRARVEGDPTAYPVKSRRLQRSQRENWWLWLQAGDHLWLEQRPATGVWAGLWSLPLYADARALQTACQQLQLVSAGALSSADGAAVAVRAGEPTPGYGAARPEVEPEALPDLRHVLTHFDWLLHPRRLRLPATASTGSSPGPAAAPWGHAGRWVALRELGSYALPAPLSRLLREHAGA